MAIELLLEAWKTVRAGFVEEVENVPADKMNFRATPDTRSIAELIQHVVLVQKVAVAEVCRTDTDLVVSRVSEIVEKHASAICAVDKKDGLIGLLNESMDEAERSIGEFGEPSLNELHRGFDGQVQPKVETLRSIIGHEMYHRGQLTVYERLLGMEPVFTTKLKKRTAAAG